MDRDSGVNINALFIVFLLRVRHCYREVKHVYNQTNVNVL
jgi:hypothetical protein